MSTSEAGRQLSTLEQIIPLPLLHKALLHRYKGPKSSHSLWSITTKVLGSKSSHSLWCFNTYVQGSKSSHSLYWFNFGAQMTHDTRVVHLGCPVLYGNKWIANKWVKFLSQFKEYPCSLKKEYFTMA